MLTTQLVRVRRRGGQITPSWIDVDEPRWLEAAEGYLQLAQGAAEDRWTRGELVAAFEEQMGDDRQVKVHRGLVKLVLDRCRFDVESPVDPPTLRAMVFGRAAARRPLGLVHDAFGRPTAGDVLAEVAAELGVTADVVERSLYGDLKDAQVIVGAKLPDDAAALLHRYNVALVQAVLLRATRVRVVLGAPSVGRVRQLLRHVKFQQLIHDATRRGDDLEVVLDGPASLFKQTTRYGVALARFLPALLLQDGPWRLEAELSWGDDGRAARLELDHTQGLRSHLRDTGAYRTREQEWFVERWGALGETGWTLSEHTEPIDLRGRGVMLPDFTFTDGERRAHLEIVGFWRKEYLARRVEGLVRHGPGNLVLAVSKNLAAAAAELDGFEGEVLAFANVVPAREVLAAIERVAR